MIEFEVNDHSRNDPIVVAAMVCLAHHVSIEVARKGVAYILSKNWGGKYDDERSGYTTFPVSDDWDGYKFSGYFSPSVSQVAGDTYRCFWEKFQEV